MAQALLWTNLIDGNTYAFDPLANDTLAFNDSSISAGDRNMVTWTGNDVVFSVGGNANGSLNKTIHLTVTGGGRGLDSTHITYANGSKLLIGDNSTAVGNGTTTLDDAGNNLTGTAGNDRFLGLGGSDTMTGNGGNDVFVLNNGANAFGNDSVDGGAGQGDAIGVGTAASILHGSDVDFDSHLVTSVDGSASFSNIENGFGTQLNDTFFAFEFDRTYSGLQTGATADFARVLEGYAGADYFEGDLRDGYFELVSYASAPSAVVVNLAEGWALDGYDSNNSIAGVQSYTDSLVDIDGVQGSAFNDLLIGGGTASGFNGMRFEHFEGMAGNDTLDANGSENVRAAYNNSPGAVVVNLATGTASDGWGGTDTLVDIRLVRGSNFNDSITGDGNNNLLEGGGGNDTVDGGAGNDFIAYSSASSAIVIDLATGTSSITGGQGTDSWVNVEGVRGGDFNDTMFGDGGDNVFEGQAGSDNINGRVGNDLVRYDRSIAAVNVNLGLGTAADGFGGTDTLIAIENIRGSTFGDTLTGNNSANVVEGWAGNDTIDGAGGVDLASYANSLGAVDVNLTTGVAGDDGWGTSDSLLRMENVRGSAFDDAITGSNVANALDGNAGADTLTGMKGDDSYVVDDARDVVKEKLDQGTDNVVASVSYALTGSVENLALSGGDAISGTGNVLDNQITGNAADNLLDGKAGNDTTVGGAGNDTYIVDMSGDVVIENAGEGMDTLKSSVTYTLSANVENLLLIGSAAIDGVGNVQGNVITGNSGINALAGGDGNDTIDGGAGADAIQGGAGQDSIIFDALDTSVDGGIGHRDALLVKGTLGLDLDSLAGSVLNGFEILDLRGAGNASVSLSLGSVQTLFGASDAEIIIYGNAGDAVYQTDAGWALEGSITMNGRLMDSYSNVDGYLLVDHSISMFSPL